MADVGQDTRKRLDQALAERAKARQKLMDVMSSQKPTTPQVQARWVNNLMKAHGRVLMAYMALEASDMSLRLTDEEREHLKYAAEYLTYGWPR